jgi:hypothetical protein
LPCLDLPCFVFPIVLAIVIFIFIAFAFVFVLCLLEFRAMEEKKLGYHGGCAHCQGRFGLVVVSDAAFFVVVFVVVFAVVFIVVMPLPLSLLSYLSFVFVCIFCLWFVFFNNKSAVYALQTYIAFPLGKKLGDVTTLNLTMLKVEATRQNIETKTKDKIKMH